MPITLIRYICPVCGGILDTAGANSFKCRHCGSVWEKERVEDYNSILEKFDAALREQRQEDLAKLVRRRYEEVTKKYVSNIEVTRVCNEILDLNPDDFFSRFYLATCKRDYTLAQFLNSMDIDEHLYAIDRMLDYIIPALKPRWINAVSTLIERAYKNKDNIKKYDLYRTQFEDMAAKVEKGIFDTRKPRNIFVAYSSKDMAVVDELVRELEENELECFVAARNLMHGSGAVENYEKAIETAMKNCKAVLFVSSTSSRNSECEAIEELYYIDENLPQMWRIEYLAEDYRGAYAERIVKRFFKGLEYCTSAEEIANRYFDKMDEEKRGAARHKTEEPTSTSAFDMEAEIQRRLAEALAKQEAERRDAERREAERREAERKEAARREAERKEAARREAERKEAERKKTERIEAERREAERKEAERKEAERKEAERKEAERREAERIAAEREKKKALEVTTIKYPNGDFYEGTVLNGKPHGKGKMTYAKDDAYERVSYEGDWVNGNCHGKGKMTFANGDVYEGDFKDDKRHGKGKYTFASGNVYEGDFIDGKFHGKGKYTFASGAVYEGDFKDDKRTGKGKYTFANGEVYEGDFIDDNFNGKGKYTFASGAVYEGDYKDGKRTGNGKYTFANGDVYEGDFIDGNFNGKGKYTYVSGAIYEGDFKDDKRTGKGKMTYKDGTVYEGDWVDGKRTGNGKLTYADGSAYEGEFKDDLRHGKVTYISADGKKQKGIWEKDYLVRRILF